MLEGGSDCSSDRAEESCLGLVLVVGHFLFALRQHSSEREDQDDVLALLRLVQSKLVMVIGDDPDGDPPQKKKKKKT